MISDLILNILYGFILLIIGAFSLLGEVTISGQFETSILYLNSLLKSVDNFLPITTLLAILAIELVIELSIFGYKAIKWAYQKVPTIN